MVPTIYKTINKNIFFSNCLQMRYPSAFFFYLEWHIGWKSDHISGSLKNTDFPMISGQAPLITFNFGVLILVGYTIFHSNFCSDSDIIWKYKFFLPYNSPGVLKLSLRICVQSIKPVINWQYPMSWTGIDIIAGWLQQACPVCIVNKGRFFRARLVVGLAGVKIIYNIFLGALFDSWRKITP